MPAVNTLTVHSLIPDQYGIDIVVKVVHPIVSVELDDNGKKVRVYEHLVGDATGCIILKSQQDLKGVIRIKKGYTQIIDGYLRLVVTNENMESISDNNVNVLLQNNLSTIKFVRKI
ncbi:hypothetical protein INT45_004595 [Circinella minor]|uniref:Uncharacterized protein n=1 Tax=Circinella minor TaxID=1195481 RepID=A0A8H7RUY9_9FUNG|nr:hypothetical protein INT45_004595 [Circinella minor]